MIKKFFLFINVLMESSQILLIALTITVTIILFSGPNAS